MHLPLRLPASFVALFLALPLSATVACEGGGEDLLGVDCGGKCDGFDDIRALLRDPLDLDLDDLVRVGAPYATDAVNDALTIGDYAQFSLGETTTFAAADLDSLRSGLAARFGETDLSTEVNRVRADHLSRSGDTVFAESSFALRSDLAAAFSFDTEDDQGSIRLGFGGTEIAVHMVAAYDDDIDAIKNAPLATIKQTGRGFVLPRSVRDIRSMKPGESIGMRSAGSLGINVGVGVPILIAEPTSALTWNLVISAGLRNQLEGDLDVQLIRLEGDQVVVDVGMERARVKSSRLAVSDSWGVQGLLEANTSIAGIDIDLGRLVERALQKQLNKRLDLVDARVESSSKNIRMSVSRLRFDLSAAESPEVEAALAQALRGDVRLAQALANRKAPGVIAEFDLSRSGISATSYAGVRLAGMEFFRTELTSSGSAVVQTPGGARALLWDSLHRASGFFLARHGFTQVALSSVGFDGRGSAMPTGEANLIIQIDEGDRAMERDKLVDYLDGLIVGIGGMSALEAIEEAGNQLEDLVETTCQGSQAFDDCPVDMVSAPEAVALREQALADFDRAVAGVDANVAAVARTAAEIRVLVQTVYEQKAQFTGPGVSLTTDFRLDEAALKALLDNGGGTRVANAVGNIISATEIDRRTDVGPQRAALASSIGGTLSEIEQSVAGYASSYRKLLNIEAAAIEQLGGIGANAIEVRFEIEGGNRVDYETAAAGTLTARRAAIASEMFSDLRARTAGLGPHAEQVAGFAILAATSASNADVRFDADLNLDDTINFWREPYRRAGLPESVDAYGKGSAVRPISAGQFEVDQLIDLR